MKILGFRKSKLKQWNNLDRMDQLRRQRYEVRYLNRQMKRRETDRAEETRTNSDRGERRRRPTGTAAIGGDGEK